MLSKEGTGGGIWVRNGTELRVGSFLKPNFPYGEYKISYIPRIPNLDNIILER